MFEEPDEEPTEKVADPKSRAMEKADEARMHAEIYAVFEGNRKFDAQLYPGLDAQIAREIQRGMGRLDKSKTAGSSILPESSAAEAAGLLKLPETRNLSTNDYHIHRRPGETMIVRWLADDQVETFYERLQAHFDTVMDGFKEDDRQNLEWKQDPKTLEYLKLLDSLSVRMAERFLREDIRQRNAFVLSTQTFDEMNIAFLCDQVMGVPAAEVVGPASAPPDEPTETDLAWFYKLFLLRGMVDGVERMCFFTFLQKSDDSDW